VHFRHEHLNFNQRFTLSANFEVGQGLRPVLETGGNANSLSKQVTGPFQIFQPRIAYGTAGLKILFQDLHLARKRTTCHTDIVTREQSRLEHCNSKQWRLNSLDAFPIRYTVGMERSPTSSQLCKGVFPPDFNGDL
jgi:hypothetical protein